MVKDRHSRFVDEDLDWLGEPETKEEKDWDESKHPRGEAGKFTESGGGDGGGSTNGIDKAEKFTPKELEAAKADVEDDFPDIKNYSVIGKETNDFNCAADACGDHADGWWWPGAGPDFHWPKEEDAPSEEAFDRLFVDDLGAEKLAPEAPNAETPEKGFVKQALFEDVAQDPTHLTELMDNGHWASKLGSSYKIEHDKLHRLDGNLYGHPAAVYKIKEEEWFKLRNM